MIKLALRKRRLHPKGKVKTKLKVKKNKEWIIQALFPFPP